MKENEGRDTICDLGVMLNHTTLQVKQNKVMSFATVSQY